MVGGRERGTMEMLEMASGEGLFSFTLSLLLSNDDSDGEDTEEEKTYIYNAQTPIGMYLVFLKAVL